MLDEDLLHAGRMCKNRERERGCSDVLAKHPVMMGQVNGKRFCGKSAGATFMTAQRPSLATGECKSETDQVCHEGSPDNQICMPKNDTERCPVTGVEVVAKSKYPDWETEVTDWKSIELDEETLIRFSKKFDALPVVTYGLDFKEPCIDDRTQINAYSHKLELQKNTTCPIE